jgi:ABC-2 type transport system permease protein
MSVWPVFLRRELRESRRDSQFWMGYGIMGLLCIVFPILIVILGPLLLKDALRGDPDLAALLRMIQRTSEFSALPPVEGLTRFLLRSVSVFYLIMSVTTASMSAAFSIVGEKQQRTLEPILATPISDRELMISKLLAVVLPSILITWTAGLIGAVATNVLGYPAFGSLVLPDRFWAMALFILAPLSGLCAALLAMRVSARLSSAQAASQFTGLVVMPGLLVIIALAGRTLTVSFSAVLIFAALLVLAVILLFQHNLRKFEREEILTRWK